MTAGGDDSDRGSRNRDGRNEREKENASCNHWKQYTVSSFETARNFNVIQMYYVRLSLTILALLALGAASWWSIRLARADAAFRHRSPAEVARALDLAPGNPTYLAALALQGEYSGQDTTPLFEDIAELNPRSSAPRIRLGLAAELRGDNVAAERWLQEAFSVDRQFETRWTLANFYFRQGRADEFWKWMRSALEMSYGDRGVAFDLCWQMTTDSNEILTRAIPDKHDVIASYLVYVLNKHRQEAIAGAANRLASLRILDDLPLLYAASDVLLDSGQTSAAADLWQALGNGRPQGVIRSDFEEPRIGHGFDWRFAELPGVTHLPIETPSAHRIRFSGQQPESAELLRQILGGLRAGVTYTLHWDARTQEIASPTGLEWRISGRVAAVRSSEDWATGQMVFTADSDHPILVLTYHRPEGQVRTQGQVDLKKVLTSSPE